MPAEQLSDPEDNNVAEKETELDVTAESTNEKTDYQLQEEAREAAYEAQLAEIAKKDTEFASTIEQTYNLATKEVFDKEGRKIVIALDPIKQKFGGEEKLFHYAFTGNGVKQFEFSDESHDYRASIESGKSGKDSLLEYKKTVDKIIESADFSKLFDEGESFDDMWRVFLDNKNGSDNNDENSETSAIHIFDDRHVNKLSESMLSEITDFLEKSQKKHETRSNVGEVIYNIGEVIRNKRDEAKERKASRAQRREERRNF